MIDPLLRGVDGIRDHITPALRESVALIGTIPAGTLTVAGLVALWLIRERIAQVVFVLPGLALGGALGWWLALGLGWHPLLAILAAIAANAVVLQILGHIYAARLGIAILAWPMLALIVWHLARGALDLGWANAITMIGSWTMAAVLYRFAQTENHELYAWAQNLIEDMRGE
jgi:hypothetical protein